MPLLLSSTLGNNILKSIISYTYTISLWGHHHQKWSLQNAAGNLFFIARTSIWHLDVLWLTTWCQSKFCGSQLILTVMNFDVHLSKTIDEDSYKVVSSWWTFTVLSVMKSSELIMRYWKIRVISNDIQTARFGFQRCFSACYPSPPQIKGSVSKDNYKPSKHCFCTVTALNILLESQNPEGWKRPFRS